MSEVLDPFEKDPLDQFLKWFKKAEQMGIAEANAMSLATVDAKGQPHLRTVLYKGLSGRRPRFFTNYQSNKAKEMAANPNIALSFYWVKPLGYQVRIEGKVEKLSRKESEDYFASRPRQSQLSAWASKQSHMVETREDLDRSFEEVSKKFEGYEVPCPPHWGGYALEPKYFDFMILDRYRLHDRFVYTKTANLWQIKRLAP